MALAYPTHISRDIERRWQRRSDATPARAPAPVNDNHAGGGLCPACGAWAPIAPVGSQYLGSGLIRHDWLCTPCGHGWTTAVRVLS